MDDLYRNTTTAMEEAGADSDYIIGWQGGYLGHPAREKQRASEAYLAGYADGQEKNTANYEKWADNK